MKLFVSDFDRTFFVNHMVSEDNIKAVKNWQQQGNLFLIATGRELTSLDTQLSKYSVYPDFYICNNGAAIYDRTQKLIYHKVIEATTAKLVVEYIYCHYENSIGVSSLMTKYKINGRFGIDTQNALATSLTIDEIVKISEFVQIHKKFTDKQLVEQLAKDVEREFGEFVSVFPNVFNVDIVSLNVNKATAIDYVARLMNVEIEATYVIGDSYNDLDMIKIYDGFVMTSAESVIKEYASNEFESVATCMKEICG